MKEAERATAQNNEKGLKFRCLQKFLGKANLYEILRQPETKSWQTRLISIVSKTQLICVVIFVVVDPRNIYLQILAKIGSVIAEMLLLLLFVVDDYVVVVDPSNSNLPLKIGDHLLNNN